MVLGMRCLFLGFSTNGTVVQQDLRGCIVRQDMGKSITCSVDPESSASRGTLAELQCALGNLSACVADIRSSNTRSRHFTP